MRAEGRNVIIAGGAIRDHLLGISFNDLDVFILGISPEKAKELFDADVSTYEGLLKAEHRHETICYTDVDLVFSSYPTPQTVLDRFDLGICKAAWDGSNFIIHEDFVTDASRGIITPCGRIFAEHGNRIIKKLKPYGFRFLGTDRDLLSA